MKAFTLAVAAAIMVTVIAIQEGSADMIIEGAELMNGRANGSPIAEGEDMPADSWKMPYERAMLRRRRCRFCCGCCPGMRGCGICCRF